MPGSVVVPLLVARARHAGARWALVALAVALAAVLPVLTQAVTRTTAGAALHRGVAQLPAGERSVTAAYTTGLTDAARLAELDGRATAELGRLGSGPIRRELLFNEIADAAGHTFRLAGTDDLPGAVRLV